MTTSGVPRIVLAWCLVAALLVPVACGGGQGGSGTSGGERAGDGGARGDGAVADGGVRDGAVRDAAVRDGALGDASRGDGGPRIGDGGVAARDAGNANPWGASREEQCAHALRPTMNAEAQRSFTTGVGQAESGDFTGANASFQRALNQDARAYRAAYNLGVIADRMGREAEALEFYRQSLRIVPSFETAIEAIVLIHLRRARNQDALAFVQPLATQYPWNDQIQATNSRVLAAMSRWDEALRAARAGLLCDERSVAALTAVARAAFGQGNLEMASWVLETLARVESADAASAIYAESHFLRGQIARDRPGELENAVREFTRAVELRGDYVDARMALGQLMLSSGNYRDATSHLAAAASAAPWAWQVRVAYADALRSSRRFDEAKRELDRAFELAPNQAEAHYSLGLLFLEQADCLHTGEASAIAPCTRALNEFNAYRTAMGSRLTATDRTAEYVANLTRIIQRMQANAQAAREAAGTAPTNAP